MFFRKSQEKAKPKGKAKEASPESSGAYRRGRRPVRVRRGVVDWRSWPWRKVASVAAVLTVVGASIYWLRSYVHTAEEFTFSEDTLWVTGVENLDEANIRALFEPDYGFSLADTPIEYRRLQLLETPWVRKATVARQWPNRIWAHVVERRPVAFVRAPEGAGETLTLRLIDDEGVFLDALEGRRWELPVVDGLSAMDSSEERAERLALFERMMRELDRGEPGYSDRLSQINLAEADNVRVTTIHEGDVVELQLGDELFRHRFEVFDRYIGSWKQQFGEVGWVDLRFEDQVVVLPTRETADATRR